MVRSEPVMGTVAVVDVRAEGAGVAAAVHDALLRLWQIEDVFSTFDPASEISKINAGDRTEAKASAEVRLVLERCRWLEAASGGAFSMRRPAAPERIDPAGYVKGWAVEEAGAVLRAAGLVDWSLNVGGDVRTSGRPEPGRAWQVAIRDPADPARVAAVVRASDAGVATSGEYERGQHLWDGRGARRPVPLGSMTVIGPDLGWADAFATTAYVLGVDQGLAFIGRFPGYEALAITATGELIGTPGFAALLAVADAG